jgi:hypothetical protein
LPRNITYLLLLSGWCRVVIKSVTLADWEYDSERRGAHIADTVTRQTFCCEVFIF